MEGSTIAAVATALTQARTDQAVEIAVLRKALDIQQQNAAQLIAAVVPVAVSNPAHLGNRVDTYA